MGMLTVYLIMPLIYTLLALQALDLITTLYVLSRGIGVEGNPLARKLMDFFGPELGLALPKIILAGGIWVVFRDTTPAWAYALLCIMYVIIVGNNLRFVLRKKQ